MGKFPLYAEIEYEDPAELFKLFAHEPWAIFLDSADAKRQLEDTNRFSYIASSPFQHILIKDAKTTDGQVINNPFNYLKSILSTFELDYQAELPPFQGGALGYFSYDLCHYLENINRPHQLEASPYHDMAIGLYDLVIAFDHVQSKAWVISTGWPLKIESARLERARQQINLCLEKINSARVSEAQNQTVDLNVDLVSPFDKAEYSALVRAGQDYILEGDIFEVNLSHRFRAQLPTNKVINNYNLYLKMRNSNPSPFSAYLNLGDHQILSASPERFLKLDNERNVSTRPIKGTAPRGKTPEEDKQISEILAASEKDRSENIMITDLLRNDLSKVCLAESVKVKKLCGLETYPSVHHLVTVVEGKLQPGLKALDLLEACFPGGSITGAPKIRAMQIIYELEPTPRGPYCGSIGYVSFNNTMDTSIVIRTLLSHENILTYQAGGAVVLDSSPESEYEETLAKSAAIMKTLTDKG